MWMLPSLIKSPQLSERVLRECGWQSECVHSLPLQTLRSADTDKSAISTLTSKQRKGERNRGVVLCRREWAQTECLCATGFGIHWTIQNDRTVAFIQSKLQYIYFAVSLPCSRGRMVIACVGFEPKTFRFSLEDKKIIGQNKYIDVFF